MHKSPSADGFSAEYYKALSTLITPELVKVFNKAASSGTLPKEMLQTLIIILPKPGKVVSIPKNVRPISLLNLDIKIYAKMLANRVMDITPSALT